MLSHLYIKDLAIVTSLAVEFASGMTSLTGETGAGKSILIDALGLVLGDRADNSLIRSGSERTEVSAVFDLSDAPRAAAWLEQQALDDGDECILRRVLVRSGSSRAYINGSPVPLKSLQALGELLVDIHGQHAHQSLLRPEQQRLLLDAFAGNRAQRKKVKQLFNDWQTARQQLETLAATALERNEHLELLQFQIDELSRLGLSPGEIEQLDQDQRLLSNASLLLQQCTRIDQLLNAEEGSVRTLLSSANRELSEILPMDPALNECQELLEGATIQIDEAISSLRSYADGVELDPLRLEQVEQQLGELHDLARKYHCRPVELPARLQTLQEELAQIEHSDLQLEALRQQVAGLEADYLAQAGILREEREAAARRLEKAVTEQIRTLAMPDGRMEIRLQPLEQSQYAAHGMDRVAFLVSTNPGQPPQPLAKVASGGELSRLSLAIQIATIGCNPVPTLIFDEVDVGIGGGVAEIVGRLLRQLGGKQQILCVTHLPQVAAQGHHHLLILKENDKAGVRSGVTPLTGEARVNEIARMLGGIKITEQTLAHAREMIGRQTDP